MILTGSVVEIRYNDGTGDAIPLASPVSDVKAQINTQLREEAGVFLFLENANGEGTWICLHEITWMHVHEVPLAGSDFDYDGRPVELEHEDG